MKAISFKIDIQNALSNTDRLLIHYSHKLIKSTRTETENIKAHLQYEEFNEAVCQSENRIELSDIHRIRNQKGYEQRQKYIGT